MNKPQLCIHVKESTRYGRLSPHSVPIEVGLHPRPHPRCPLESSNGAPHRMRSQRRFLSFIEEAPSAQLRRMMTTDPYVTTHFFQALTLNSPWCSLLHDGGGMTRTDVSTPPAAPATLGDGCDRTGSPVCGSAGHTLARIAQLRHGCCPPPASLTPMACGCCKPPLNRASQQLPQLSCSRRRAPPPCSASSAPHRACLTRVAVHGYVMLCYATARLGHKLASWARAPTGAVHHRPRVRPSRQP